MFVFNVVSAFN